MWEFDLLKVLGLGLEAKEGCCVANIAEEENSGDGGYEEKDGYDLVEIL